VNKNAIDKKMVCTLSQKDNIYIFTVCLGRLRGTFSKVGEFKLTKEALLEELARMNGSDKALVDKKYLLLIKKLRYKPTEKNLEDMGREFLSIVEKYKHMLHYILVMDKLLKDNSSVYSIVKDSAVLEDVKLSKYGQSNKNQSIRPAKVDAEKIENEFKDIYWDTREFCDENIKKRLDASRIELRRIRKTEPPFLYEEDRSR